MKVRIIKNAAKCNYCGDVIERIKDNEKTFRKIFVTIDITPLICYVILQPR